MFVVISYITGQMMQAYTGFIPFTRAVSAVLHFLPFIPRYQREHIDERFAKRFSWACDRLFYDHDEIELPKFSLLNLDRERMMLARSYLKKKNVVEIQIYDDLSSSFYELEVLFLTALMVNLYLIHPKDIVLNSPKISEFHIPIILFLLFVFFRILRHFQSLFTEWRRESQVHKDLEKWELNRNVDIELLYGRLSELFLILMSISIFILVSPVSIEYTPNLKSILGPDFVYSPILFGFHTYSSAYVKSRYSRLEKETIIQDLYTVAIAEGDIEDE